MIWNFRLIPRTQEMTQLLLSHGIMSKVQLLETWKADRNCKYMFFMIKYVVFVLK